MPTNSCVRELAQARRVLIVDDQQDAAELMAMLLAEHGYEVRVASDGAAALALAAEFSPQVALLDIGLPTMNGYELAVLMRATPELAKCRLIAVSGHCGAADRARSQSAGFEAHLAKPLGVEALLRSIAAPVDAERVRNG